MNHFLTAETTWFIFVCKHDSVTDEVIQSGYRDDGEAVVVHVQTHSYLHLQPLAGRLLALLTPTVILLLLGGELIPQYGLQLLLHGVCMLLLLLLTACVLLGGGQLRVGWSVWSLVVLYLIE